MNKNSTSLLAATLIFWMFFPAKSYPAVSDTVQRTAITHSASALTSCGKISGNKLDIGSSCTTIVKATESENIVGLKIVAGEEYTITSAEKQTWHDASRSNMPPCGEPGSFMMNLFAILKKARKSLWFSLIAEIKDEKKPYDLCEAPNFLASGNGELILYANDAKGFYYNNSGEIIVEIRRNK